jgi:hydroxymethylglutaryl-CoA lyase
MATGSRSVAPRRALLYTERMVELIEVAPRDGLQNESTLLDTATKVALIERAIAAGARRIEATSFVHPKLVPAMADAEDVMAAVPRRDDVSYIGLVLNRRGLDRALAAGVDEINAVVVASDTFNRRNQGVSTDESLAAWAGMAAAAHEAGVRASLTIAAAFGCPFEGEVDPDHVLRIAERALASGPDELALADTIGVGVPRQVRTLVGGVRELDTEVPLRLHLHNTRNTGYANALAGIEAGVAALDASLGGIGGCPFAPNATGNIATEDLVYLLERSGVATELDLDRLNVEAAWLGEQLGTTVPGQLSRAGTFP